MGDGNNLGDVTLNLFEWEGPDRGSVLFLAHFSTPSTEYFARNNPYSGYDSVANTSLGSKIIRVPTGLLGAKSIVRRPQEIPAGNLQRSLHQASREILQQWCFLFLAIASCKCRYPRTASLRSQRTWSDNDISVVIPRFRAAINGRSNKYFHGFPSHPSSEC